MALKKTDVFVSFDPESLVELKRSLFQHGITIHQFFGKIAELTSMNDPRISEIMEETKSYKKQRMVERGEKDKVSAEVLYDLIEEELKKN